MKKHVCVISREIYPFTTGGCEIQASEFIHWLIDHDEFDPYIITQSPIDNLLNVERSKGIHTTIPGLRTISFILILRDLRRFRIKKFSGIYAYMIFNTLLGLILKSLLRSPLIVRPSGGDLNMCFYGNRSRRIIYSSLFRFMLNKSDGIIALSDDMEKRLLGIGVERTKIFKIANPVGYRFSREYVINQSQKKEKINLKYQLSEKTQKIIAIGRITKSKGFHIIIKALSELKSKNYKMPQLIIVGEGPYLRNLRDLVQYYQLDDFVTFTGKIAYEEVPFILFHAHLFVFPSIEEEGSPNTIIQSIRMEIPCIMSDLVSLNPYDQKSLKYKFKVGDHLALAKLIIKYLGNPNERKKLIKEQYNLILGNKPGLVYSKFLDLLSK